ncbi:MAG: hypothetical protein ISS36_02850 [Candidatus Aenigmarchaeota archaeon]|nr:hypothetical protein [Candidatus Aenigmarchaeota archaeon]
MENKFLGVLFALALLGTASAAPVFASEGSMEKNYFGTISSMNANPGQGIKNLSELRALMADDFTVAETANLEVGKTKPVTGINVFTKEKIVTKNETNTTITVWKIVLRGIKGENNYFRGFVEVVDPEDVIKMKTRKFEKLDFSLIEDSKVGFTTKTKGGREIIKIKTQPGATLRFHVTSTIDDLPILIGPDGTQLTIEPDINGFYNFELTSV